MSPRVRRAVTTGWNTVATLIVAPGAAGAASYASLAIQGSCSHAASWMLVATIATLLLAPMAAFVLTRPTVKGDRWAVIAILLVSTAFGLVAVFLAGVSWDTHNGCDT